MGGSYYVFIYSGQKGEHKFSGGLFTIGEWVSGLGRTKGGLIHNSRGETTLNWSLGED